MDIKEEELYSLKEVANILKIKHQTVRLWNCKGKINSIKINGVVRVSGKELLKLMKGE